jgi:single-stranded DNA-binding protein
MASLIFAAGFLTYNKVKDKKEKKREKKRKVHEEWYEDLQREHSRGVEEKGKVQSPQSSGSNPFEETEKKTERRSSSDSHRSQDGPDKWVDEVIKERRKSMGTEMAG